MRSSNAVTDHGGRSHRPMALLVWGASTRPILCLTALGEEGLQIPTHTHTHTHFVNKKEPTTTTTPPPTRARAPFGDTHRPYKCTDASAKGANDAHTCDAKVSGGRVHDF